MPTATYTYDIAGGLPLLLDDGTRKYVWGLDPPDDIAAARRQVRDGGRLQ